MLVLCPIIMQPQPALVGEDRKRAKRSEHRIGVHVHAQHAQHHTLADFFLLLLFSYTFSISWQVCKRM